MNEVYLPATIKNTSIMLSELTKALKIPRDILPDDEEIEHAWKNLPRVLTKISPELRTEALARMCIAVGVGLFDSAINYAWNAAIIELRNKVKTFGLNVVSQIIGKDFDEKVLLDLKDAELLTLCLQLNLIAEDGFFFLDQCRDIRNNFSVAHPSAGLIDETELINFINRCAKYALTPHVPVGVDIQAFIQAIKVAKFTKEQRDQWSERLRKTHEPQRELLLEMLHGIYCDPAASEEARLNALYITKEFVNEFTPKIKSNLIIRHSEYLASGEIKRHKASQQYFERLGLIKLLSDTERHSLISNACKMLMNVHQAFQNFYNEPPFAERLLQLYVQGEIPDTVKDEFVTTVVTCAVGNAYGVSHAAYPYYEKIIRNFSPKEIGIMLNLIESSTVVGQRIKAYKRCKETFKTLVSLLDIASVPQKLKQVYKEWID